MSSDKASKNSINNSSLSELRAEIDALTQEIYATLDKRLGVVKKVGELKASINNDDADYYRADREALMLAAMKQKNFRNIPSLKAAQLLKEIISMSLSVEAVQSVAFIQSADNISGLAAMDRFGHQAEFVPCQSLDQAIALIRSKQCCHGVLPVTIALLSELLQSTSVPELIIKGRIHFPQNQYHQDYLVVGLCHVLSTKTLDKTLYWIEAPDSDATSQKNSALSDSIAEMVKHVPQTNTDFAEIVETNKTIGYFLTHDGDTPSDDILAWLQNDGFSIHLLGYYPHFDSDLSTAIVTYPNS